MVNYTKYIYDEKHVNKNNNTVLIKIIRATWPPEFKHTDYRATWPLHVNKTIPTQSMLQPFLKQFNIKPPHSTTSNVYLIYLFAGILLKALLVLLKHI